MSEPPGYESISDQPPRDPYAALRFGAFRRYQAGFMASVIGQQIQSVAVQWEVYQRTGQKMSLGWVGLVQAAPVILLALPAGHLADRFDRRKILIVTQLLSAVCSIGLASVSHYFHGAQVQYLLLLYLLLGLGATAQALGWPARSALLPQIVPAEVFPNAVTWSSSAFQMAALAGPALGGIIIYFSVPAAYLADAFLACGFALYLLTIHPVIVARRREPVTVRSLIAGIHYVWNTKLILATITMDLFAVLFGGATYLLPVFAKDILHVGQIAYGIMRAAPAAGALAMALIVAHMPPMKRAGITLLWSVAGFGAAWIVFGISRSYVLSLAMLILTGALDNISVVVRHTLVQMLTPDAMRGRVSAVNNVFIGASNELGGFESGVTAAWLGTARSVIFGGVGSILVVLGVAIAWPQVRRLGSLQQVKPNDAENLV